jgi:integrase
MRGCLQKAKTKRELPGESAWDIILALGRGEDGKHKQRWVRFHGTRKQAQQKLTELTGEVHRGEFVEPSKLTVGHWLDEWLEKAIRPPRCTPNTYKVYFGIVKKHLKPGLGHLLLQQLTPLQVERYYVERGVKLAERSIAVHHAILTSALSAAMASGVLRQNVAKRATNKPRVRTSEDVLHNVWTGAEARRFLTTVKQTGNAQYAALFALALDSGMRKSELLGLQWKDIDGASLRVERQLLGLKKDEATGVASLDTSLPKGKRARQLDLSEETVALLREHKRQQAELKLKNRLQYVDHGLVFAQVWEHKSSKHATLGWPLHREVINRQLDKSCCDADVKRITVHGLRHTCATLLLSAGVPAHVVQRRLGHKGVEMTLNMYAHVLPSMQSDAASRLATLLHG